jgi:hypothetical protein
LITVAPILTPYSVRVIGIPTGGSDEDRCMWHAKIVGFEGKVFQGLEKKDKDVIEVSEVEGVKVVVDWFYSKEDLLVQPEDAVTDKQISMLFEAMNEDHLLLGKDLQPIEITTIDGE